MTIDPALALTERLARIADPCEARAIRRVSSGDITWREREALGVPIPAPTIATREALGVKGVGPHRGRLDAQMP
jgi:hypothetical protein